MQAPPCTDLDGILSRSTAGVEKTTLRRVWFELRSGRVFHVLIIQHQSLNNLLRCFFRDLAEIFKEKPHGIHAATDSDDITKVCRNYYVWREISVKIKLS